MKIFLSYPSEVRSTAEPIAFSLRSRGHHVFFDRDDLPAGKSYDDQIQNAIEQSDVLIYLISPWSVEKGRYTLTELELARRIWRHPADRVLPVMVEPTDIAKVPSFLKGVTILEPQGSISAEVAAAVETLRDGGVALRSVARSAALSGAITAVILLIFSQVASWQIPMAVILGSACGVPLSVLLFLWSRNQSWRLFMPPLAMLIAVQLAQPFFLKGPGVVTPIALHELSEVALSEANGDDYPHQRIVEQLEGWNAIAHLLNRYANWSIYGAILMFGVLAGTLPVLAPWLSVGRCLMCVVVGSAAAVIAAEIGMSLFDTFMNPVVVGFALYMTATGAALGFWHARGRVQ